MYDADEKPKRGINDPRDAACQVCGVANYEWGKPGTEGGLYFLPEGAIFGFGMGERLAARKCLNCGNIQFFIRDGYLE
jgi:hypothetical protein